MNVYPGPNLFSILRDAYGQDSLRLVRRVVGESCRIVRYSEHLNFNHTCKREGLIPKDLRVKPLVDTVEGRGIAARSSRQYLSARISLCHEVLFRARRTKEALLAQMLDTFNSSICDDVLTEVAKEERFVRTKVQAGHVSKLSRLREEQSSRQGPPKRRGKVDTSRWVVNKSNRVLTAHETSVLAKGLNFAPAPGKVPVPQILAAVEPALNAVGGDEAHILRSQIASVLSGAKPPCSNLSRDETEALKSLRRDESIVILNADKGRTVVVMDRSSYREKVLSMLDDEGTYEKLDEDPTKRFQKDLIVRLRGLKKAGKFDKAVYDRIYCSYGRIPLFYGLPKIHKDGMPLRPIVSFCSSPTYELAKHLKYLLSPLLGNAEFAVKNSVDFCEGLKDIEICDDEIMVSFDVVSLFTCIPTAMAVSVALERLKNDESLADRSMLSPEEICNLLQFCLSTTAFAFEGKYYQQKWGTAMGSPISPVVANLCLEQLENSILSNPGFHVKMWKRYVDDTFVVLPKTKLDDLHSALNSFNSHIQFTVETEKDSALPFLDVLVTRDHQGRLRTSVYRKPTHTDRYLDFDSHHPRAHKVSVVRTLSKRVESHCIDSSVKSKEVQHINRTLQANGYPRKFISRCCRPPERRDETGETRTRGYAVIPYVKGVSEGISRLLRAANVKTFYKPHNTLRGLLTRVKDPVPKEQTTGAVYRIPCGECPKVYTGETERMLTMRQGEHEANVRNGIVVSTSISNHAITNLHQPDWAGTSILHRNVKNRTTRRFLETWESHKVKELTTNSYKPLPSAYVILANRKKPRDLRLRV